MEQRDIFDSPCVPVSTHTPNTNVFELGDRNETQKLNNHNTNYDIFYYLCIEIRQLAKNGQSVCACVNFCYCVTPKNIVKYLLRAAMHDRSLFIFVRTHRRKIRISFFLLFLFEKWFTLKLFLGFWFVLVFGKHAPEHLALFLKFPP